MTHPIGIFDSGYGGLTVLKEIVRELPDYDFVYLGDNARAPYGTRSFETVYRYTLQSVEWLFQQGCPLVVLACNTASAKALRSIQQNDLPKIAREKRVLGVIRPTAEIIGNFSDSGEIGVLATNGTVLSESYRLEINKFFPETRVFQQACPMWVPLIENGEMDSPGADYFVKKSLDQLMNQSPRIDTVLLGCTHYPLLMEKIKIYLPSGIRIISQGEIVAQSLKNYLGRHPEIDSVCTKNSKRAFFTTDSVSDFNRQAKVFFGEDVNAQF
ncbi:MAG TPA: glutamate racemase, partial [Parasegetibacter sp.]